MASFDYDDIREDDKLTVCRRCGSVVAEREQLDHDIWHEQIDRINGG